MLKLNKELIKGSTITLILNELSKEPMYGYKMIKEIEGKSNGVFIFKEGTLYPILHDLEKKKLIESYWEVENGRRRKYYKNICICRRRPNNNRIKNRNFGQFSFLKLIFLATLPSA